jgi:hypothetical protein
MTQIEQSMEKRSQTDRIIEWLSDGKEITAVEALNLFGCFRLAARIADIRSRGYDVETTYRITKNGARIAVYRMPDAA